jgi:hypothetical protein
MLPKIHVVLGAIFSLVLFLSGFSLADSSLVFLSSFLIDFDHYLYGVVKKKTLNYKEIYSFLYYYRERWLKLNYSQKIKRKYPILIFHGVESIMALGILSIFSSLFFFILLGFIIHLGTDYFEIIKNRDPWYTKISFLYILITNKDKKRLVIHKN